MRTKRCELFGGHQCSFASCVTCPSTSWGGTFCYPTIAPRRTHVSSPTKLYRVIVVQFNVSGVQVHDARLVAAMRVNNFTHILTFNSEDFLRYVGVDFVVVDPRTL